MNAHDYDIIMAQINEALESKAGDKPNSAKISQIIRSTECPYLMALIQSKLPDFRPGKNS
ncbi:MAG: hypothetical protein AAFQ94_10080 [Bacteroidota bacterium]